MLKLNENYSDYVDMDDVNYPEGKAVNASNSESFDGTPLLASFMNDVNAAHIAMYEKAYGNRDGIDGEADSQKASQFADAVAKYTDDKVSDHAGKRGLADGVHGATSEASAGQIATRDENGNLKVGTPIQEAHAANKGWVEGITGLLSALVTEAKSTLVAAINEVRNASTSNKDAIDTHVAKKDNPHGVTKSQLGLGNVDNTADSAKTVSKANQLTTARNIDGVSFNGTASIVHWGTCDTAAATQAKVVSCAGFSLSAGSRITVKFTNGNTSGSVKGNTTTNKIPQASAPTMNVNNTGAKQIKVGGEFAGEGFINAGDVHDFVYDGTFWNDVTADVIYQGGDETNGYYVKKRNGLIEQNGFVSKGSDLVSSENWSVMGISIPIKFSNLNFGLSGLIHLSDVSGGVEFSVRKASTISFDFNLYNRNGKAILKSPVLHWFARGY